jgi:hypothetical protein
MSKLQFYSWRVPFANASGSGYALQVLTGYACCGLSAAIPHASALVHIRYTRVRHAKGMREHGATHRSDSVARSTPTAPRSKQERPKMLTHTYSTQDK